MAARALGQDRPPPIIGFLSSLSAGALSGPITAFRAGLKSVGYEDGKNVAIQFRWTDGHYDQLPGLAGDLARAGAAVIVTVGGDPPAFAAKAVSKTIPLVFMIGRNPVELVWSQASISRAATRPVSICLLLKLKRNGSRFCVS